MRRVKDLIRGSGPTDVLLFYDGFELRAEEDLPSRLSEEIRRGTRFIYKKLRRRHTRTGFYTWFLMLCRALESAGCRVHVNDFAAARRSPRQPIGAAGYSTILEKLKVLPNPRLIGPGLYSSPLENPNLFDDTRNVIFLQTCEWYEDMFRPWYGERMRRWFGGFDVADFPDGRSAFKKWDVLIYDKINFDRDIYYPQTIERFSNLLGKLRLSYKIIRYGNYTYQEYLKSVRSSRCMAFFAHSETQGMAYQECLASNVPIFAWDEGIWVNPDAKELGRGPIYCTSVPYFDERCGMTFNIASMVRDWDRFYEALNRFDSRGFIAEKMSLAKSAAVYLSAYEETYRLSLAPHSQ
jgi:hypothetical protein